MQTETVSIRDIKPNPENPRVIKDQQFKKLVKSIKEFPEMLQIRPIVVNSDMVVLGGNMRLRACKDAGLKEVPIIKADQLTPEQQREFIIKDNVSGGEWDWDILANEWEIQDLSDWGIDIPAAYFDNDIEPEFDVDEMNKHLDTYINNKIKQITLFFDVQQYEVALQRLDAIAQAEQLESNTDVVMYLLEKYRKQ